MPFGRTLRGTDRSLIRASLVPLATLACLLLLRVADPLPIQTLRNLTFDNFERWAPRTYQDAGVRVVDIDEQSLARYGQWPWSRGDVAHLVDRLGASGAAAIALDIVFAEPDRTSPRLLLPEWRRWSASPLPDTALAALPDPDELLAKAVARTPTVLGIVLTDERKTVPAPHWGIAETGSAATPSLLTFDGAVANLPALEAAATAAGALNSDPDRDGVVRQVPLLFRIRNAGIYPALAAEALRVAAHASSYVLKSGGLLLIGELAVPLDGRGRVTLYDTGPQPQRTIPAWKILDNAVARDEIAGKIIFIGTSAAGLNDLRTTPLRPLVPGVEVHAQIAEQLRLGALLERPTWMNGAELAWMLVLSAALLWALVRVGPIPAAMLGAASVALSAVLSWFVFRRFDVLFDPIYPALAALAVYLVQSLIGYMRTEGDRRYLKEAFGRYVSPDLLEQIARDSGRLRLGGEMREMTILFCDIRGFTSLAETMDAEALTHFVNGFLTPMSECVLARRGTIDKYIGDCVMAFWNAPLAEPLHAECAIRAALDMMEALVVLNQGWRHEATASGRDFPDIAVGIGMATGRCCVGNLGSEQRFDYSVLGDDVNLASRLEAQTKRYGFPIIISEATQSAVPHFATLELDLLQVKGKSQPQRIFAVLGDERTAAEDWYRALVQDHGAMLAAFRAQAWQEATDRLDRTHATAPASLRDLYELYALRIAQFEAAPPEPGWDGVMIAESK